MKILLINTIWMYENYINNLFFIFIKIFLYLVATSLSVKPFGHDRWMWKPVKHVETDVDEDKWFFKLMGMIPDASTPYPCPFLQAISMCVHSDSGEESTIMLASIRSTWLGLFIWPVLPYLKTAHASLVPSFFPLISQHMILGMCITLQKHAVWHGSLF